MIRDILSIAGKPGLYKLLTQSRKGLIVESLDSKKRRQMIQLQERVVSLADISIYTDDGDYEPLGPILDKVYEVLEGAAMDKASFTNMDRDELFESFAEVLPNFDRDRVYPSDIKKLYGWYNLLVDAGYTKFVDEESEEVTEKEEK